LTRAKKLAGEHGFHLLVVGAMRPDIVETCHSLTFAATLE